MRETHNALGHHRQAHHLQRNILVARGEKGGWWKIFQHTHPQKKYLTSKLKTEGCIAGQICLPPPAKCSVMSLLDWKPFRCSNSKPERGVQAQDPSSCRMAKSLNKFCARSESAEHRCSHNLTVASSNARRAVRATMWFASCPSQPYGCIIHRSHKHVAALPLNVAACP